MKRLVGVAAVAALVLSGCGGAPSLEESFERCEVAGDPALEWDGPREFWTFTVNGAEPTLTPDEFVCIVSPYGWDEDVVGRMDDSPQGEQQTVELDGPTLKWIRMGGSFVVWLLP